MSAIRSRMYVLKPRVPEERYCKIFGSTFKMPVWALQMCRPVRCSDCRRVYGTAGGYAVRQSGLGKELSTASTKMTNIGVCFEEEEQKSCTTAHDARLYLSILRKIQSLVHEPIVPILWSILQLRIADVAASLKSYFLKT